jgi:hypothetical protein
MSPAPFLTDFDMAAGRQINWVRLSTLVAVAILVGTEMVGASWAAGWAIGGMMQLAPVISRSIEVLFGLCGFLLLIIFMRTAIRHEPVRD